MTGQRLAFWGSQRGLERTEPRLRQPAKEQGRGAAWLLILQVCNLSPGPDCGAEMNNKDAKTPSPRAFAAKPPKYPKPAIALSRSLTLDSKRWTQDSFRVPRSTRNVVSHATLFVARNELPLTPAARGTGDGGDTSPSVPLARQREDRVVGHRERHVHCFRLSAESPGESPG